MAADKPEYADMSLRQMWRLKDRSLRFEALLWFCRKKDPENWRVSGNSLGPHRWYIKHNGKEFRDD